VLEIMGGDRVATGEQIKSLVKAHVDRNDEKVRTVVLRIAAHEAKIGHDKLARDLKKLVDKHTARRGSIAQLSAQNPMLDLEDTRMSRLCVSSLLKSWLGESTRCIVNGT